MGYDVRVDWMNLVPEHALATKQVDMHLDLVEVLLEEIDEHFESMVHIVAQMYDKKKVLGCLFASAKVGKELHKIVQHLIKLIQLGQVALGEVR